MPVAGILASAMLAAGCGGSGSATTVTSSSLSHAEFAKKANAICVRERGDMLQRLESYVKQHASKEESNPELFADAARAVLLPTIETDLVKIRKLGAPAGDEARVEAILAAQQQAVDAASKRKSLSSRFPLEAYFKHAAGLARSYGLRSCVNYSPGRNTSR
jgi:hypothetical protein